MGVELKRPSFFSPMLIMTLIVGAAAGAGVLYAATLPTTQQLQTSLSSAKSTVDRLNSERANLRAKLNSTDVLLAETQTQLSQTEANLRQNQTELVKVHAKLGLLQNATSKLEVDKILLGDLRKDIPTTRAEARIFWEGVKNRAINADPSLGVSVDKILATLDKYYADWVYPAGNATTSQQIGQILVNASGSGAFDYLDNITKFQQDALLTVIISIDLLTTLLT